MRKSRALARFGTILLLFTVAAGTPCDVVAEGECGFSNMARQRLENELARLVAGLTFDQVRAAIGDPAQAKESWGAPPRAEILWTVSGRDGSRLAVQDIVCDFDKADGLVGCKPRQDAREVQEITVNQYDALAEGEPEQAIVSHLCAPGQKQVKDRDSVFEYSVLRPSALSNRTTCPAFLHFREGRLVKKEMLCRDK